MVFFFIVINEKYGIAFKNQGASFMYVAGDQFTKKDNLWSLRKTWRWARRSQAIAIHIAIDQLLSLND